MDRRVLDLRFLQRGGRAFELADVVLDGRSLLAIAEGRPASKEEWLAEVDADDRAVLGGAVKAFVDTQGHRRDRSRIVDVLSHCVMRRGSVEIPKAASPNYVNLRPPRVTHLRRRIGGIMITPGSSRFGVTGLGPISLDGFEHAEETLENGEYVYPKIAALDSDGAVEEAKRLIDMALHALER